MQTEINIIEIPWIEITPSPLNTLVRGTTMAGDDPETKDLANSILEHGIVQPLVVKQSENGYELVVGERRWLATQSLGDKAPLLPCQVRAEMSELEQLLVMGVENLQRKNLSPITEANYYQRLLDRGLSLAQILQQLGLKRERVSSRLALLQLAPSVQALLHTRSFPLTAAKHLQNLPPETQVEVAQKMAGRPVRDIAQVVKLVKKELAATVASPAPVDEKVSQAENKVSNGKLGYKAQGQELKEMLAKLVAYTQQTGQLLAECALALEEFDPDLALTVGGRAQQIEDAIDRRFGHDNRTGR